MRSILPQRVKTERKSVIAFRVLKILWRMKALTFEVHKLTEQVGMKELAILVALGEHSNREISSRGSAPQRNSDICDDK